MGFVSKIQLPQVTLVTVDGRPGPYFTEMTHKALAFSMRHIQFGEVKFLCHNPPRLLADGIQVE